jgi:hypothetical protein
MKKLLFLVLLLNSFLAYGGGEVRVKGHKFRTLPFVDGIWQGSYFGQLEIGHVYDIHYVDRHWWHTILAYSKVGVEYNLTPLAPHGKPGLWAPEFSSELEWGYFCVRGNIEDFIEPGVNKFYVVPEIGFSIAGFITLAGGYNEPISKPGLSVIKPYRVSIYWMIPFVISGASKNHN